MQVLNLELRRDSLTIRGKIYGDTSQKRHVFILSHGFLANQSTCKDYAKLLAELGCIAITFDFCGGGLGSKSDGKSVDMTLLTERDDLAAVVRCVQEQPFTDGISLLGCSQGGFVSALVAKQLQEEISSLILLYPAFCIPDDARKGQMINYKFDPENIPKVLGRLPMKLGGDYARVVMDMDPFAEISGYAGPVLYLHGTEDKLVDISYARIANCVYLGCEYYEIMGGGHGFKGAADTEACQLIRQFVERHVYAEAPFDTLVYYNDHATEYVAATVDVDFHETQNWFLQELKEDALILDFGCGSGRDTKYFLEKGFSVEAIDGSEVLCEAASELTGIAVKQMLFQDLDVKARYDGIWACASILHLPKPNLVDVMEQMRDALKENGVIYSSFKYGDAEGMRDGRYFTDFTEESFHTMLAGVEGLRVERIWITTDVRPDRRDEKWLNVLMCVDDGDGSSGTPPHVIKTFETL